MAKKPEVHWAEVETIEPSTPSTPTVQSEDIPPVEPKLAVEPKKSESTTLADLQRRLDDLERLVLLMMVGSPKWVGYVTEDSKFIDAWYANAKKVIGTNSRGVRD